MTTATTRIADLPCGKGHPLLLIAGPCVIQDEALTMEIAKHLVTLAAKHQVSLVFKASFDKANRSAIGSYRGPGLQDGVRIFEQLKRQLNVPIITDVHEISQQWSVHVEIEDAERTCCA